AGTSGNSQTFTVTTSPPSTPPVPTGLVASSITNNSFVLTWPPSTGATNYRLDVSADDFATYVSGYNNLVVNGTSQLVTGLNSNTTYSFRARSVNAGGVSGNSTSGTQTTLPVAPV